MGLATARDALAAYGLKDAALRPVEVGLINLTFDVESHRGRFALQRLNPIFDPRIHLTIERVTAHLEARGLQTPRLERTRSGRLWTTVGDDDEVWRLMSWIEGESYERVSSPKRLFLAGELLGRFHRALADLDHDFPYARLGVHDTPAHLTNLERAIDDHREHPLHDDVAPLAERILETYAALGPLPDTPRRPTHGDPKISNVLFSAGETPERALCLVDLDTLAPLRIPIELGDALRSWCNPNSEDAPEATFSVDLLDASVRGYRVGSDGLLTREEIDALVDGAYAVLIELAARFAADALQERYFGWNPERFDTRGAHNLVRAQRQLAVADHLARFRDEARRCVDAAFAT